MICFCLRPSSGFDVSVVTVNASYLERFHK